MADTPEYNTLCDCVPVLRISAKTNLLSLSGELLAARIISVDTERGLRNRNVDVGERAAELVDLVLLKVQEDHENFNKFMNILCKDRDQYKTVIAKLEDGYKAYHEKLAIPTMNGAKQEAKGSVIDGSSQTQQESCTQLQGVSSEQRQSTHGTLCSCPICISYLGCPDPLPAGTFPFLEDVEGLDGRQKEELKEQLKESTESIMKAYYSLLSEFYISLMKRAVSVEDVKTHLMVLNVYNDDSEKQHLFQDQMDSLKQASTMNAVFDVLQGFSSFVNYDLIEHLIGLLGSGEDKERLKRYKEQFTEYAKRRLYECPSNLKVATSVASHCDVYVKVESRFEKFSLHELGRFRKNLSDLLGIKRYVIHLCCIEKGCIRLTFQIPNFVTERVFPLSPQQIKALPNLGVRQLTCGKTSYEFLEDSPESKSIPTPDAAIIISGTEMCSDCGSQTSEVALIYKKHRICSSCLIDRSNMCEHSETLLDLECNVCHPSPRSYRDIDILMSDYVSTNFQNSNSARSTQCLEMTPPPLPSSEVWIFVDDPNIWIEAKKLGSKFTVNINVLF